MINQLIVFLKSPRLGQVKTRLAKDVGAEEALSVYRWLIDYTFFQIAEIDAKTFSLSNFRSHLPRG